jgi:hypothetical protein
MRVIKRDVERSTVIRAYAKYDCSKKGGSVPDLATWNLSQADLIDQAMGRAGLKKGIPAGYILWDKVEVTITDLRDCAVAVDIFPGQPRKLGLVGGLVDWESKFLRHLAKKGSCVPTWYEKIKSGEALDETAPLILRPALSGESPAVWYVEDGSGRAITFLANQIRFGASKTLAFGYLGRQPDPRSSFMQQGPFVELLRR